MKTPDEIKEALADENPEAKLADGFDEALVGIGYRLGKPALAVYSVQKCIDVLMKRDGMDYDGALECLEFNSIGAWFGPHTPIWLYD